MSYWDDIYRVPEESKMQRKMTYLTRWDIVSKFVSNFETDWLLCFEGVFGHCLLHHTDNLSVHLLTVSLSVAIDTQHAIHMSTKTSCHV